jgi:hypothetical protein
MTKIAGSRSGSISQRHRSADPDPHQNVMDPEHCLKHKLRNLSFDHYTAWKVTATSFFIDFGCGKVLKSEVDSRGGGDRLDPLAVSNGLDSVTGTPELDPLASSPGQRRSRRSSSPHKEQAPPRTVIQHVITLDDSEEESERVERLGSSGATRLTNRTGKAQPQLPGTWFELHLRNNLTVKCFLQ